MRKLMTIILMLIVSTSMYAQENPSKYTTVGKVSYIGKYDFAEHNYVKEEIEDIQLSFLVLSLPGTNIQYCRITYDIGAGTTTHDYLIESIEAISNQSDYNKLSLLSPFGEHLILKYNDKAFYLYYAKDLCAIEGTNKDVFRRYYTGNLINY